jgi:hypothetical protein
MRFRAAAMLLLACVTSARAGAQTGVQLLLSGDQGSFAVPTPADYAAGTLEAASPIDFQVITTSEPAGPLTTTVYIRSFSSTIGAGKPVADLEWRRGDEQTWHALTTTDAIVERRVVQGSPQGHTWNNTIHVRVALNWGGDPPATYVGNLVLTVSTIQP